VLSSLVTVKKVYKEQENLNLYLEEVKIRMEFIQFCN